MFYLKEEVMDKGSKKANLEFNLESKSKKKIHSFSSYPLEEFKENYPQQNMEYIKYRHLHEVNNYILQS